MRHLPHVFGLVGCVAIARAAGAEQPAILAVPAPLPAIAVPASVRAISPETAAKLATLAPKFSEFPPPAQPPPNPAAVDRPRNTIIRLPAYTVTESKIALPKERHVLTPEGRLELAYRRNPGLRLGALGPLHNDFWANALLDEDFAAERSAELNDLLSLLPGPRRTPVRVTAPPNVIPPRSGPYGGLLVPWERK